MVSSARSTGTPSSGPIAASPPSTAARAAMARSGWSITARGRVTSGNSLVQVLNPRYDRPGHEKRCSLLRGACHLLTCGSVTQDSAECLAEQQRIARLDEQAGFALNDEVGHSAVPRPDDGHAGGHCLENDGRAGIGEQ